MTKSSVVHGTFTVEKTYAAAPARVFAAWADPKIKARWFMGGTEPDKYAIDFKVGGKETNTIPVPGGPLVTYDGTFYDIVPDERIIYAYMMSENGEHSSVSLTSVELKPEGTGTRLVLTEQASFLDGHDSPAQREAGNNFLLNALAIELQKN